MTFPYPYSDLEGYAKYWGLPIHRLYRTVRVRADGSWDWDYDEGSDTVTSKSTGSSEHTGDR